MTAKTAKAFLIAKLKERPHLVGHKLSEFGQNGVLAYAPYIPLYTTPMSADRRVVPVRNFPQDIVEPATQATQQEGPTLTMETLLEVMREVARVKQVPGAAAFSRMTSIAKLFTMPQ